jgi:hypothetical protein
LRTKAFVKELFPQKAIEEGKKLIIAGSGSNG